jgi:hypothetical protein
MNRLASGGTLYRLCDPELTLDLETNDAITELRRIAGIMWTPKIDAMLVAWHPATGVPLFFWQCHGALRLEASLHSRGYRGADGGHPCQGHAESERQVATFQENRCDAVSRHDQS